MRDLGLDVLGVDLSPVMIDLAREAYPELPRRRHWPWWFVQTPGRSDRPVPLERLRPRQRRVDSEVSGSACCSRCSSAAVGACGCSLFLRLWPRTWRGLRSAGVPRV
ncbi:hypothetical protein [Streptomyces xantholiticus]|uniref:hypothetical protein n=1 Tax=Streptomyces xantholiticus TaxID=68285 RepID=UPI003D9E1F35